MADFPSNTVAAPGVLLVAHGSPNPEWNRPVLDFGKRVEEAILIKGGFKTVRTALLEAAEPSIPTAVAELEAAGCDRIIAVPLFILPSGHTDSDVPAALGIDASPDTSQTRATEDARPAHSRAPITLLPTLSEGDLLQQYVADQIRKLSQSPQEEAVVILAHGDPEHPLLIDGMLRRIAPSGSGQTGVDYADWACVGMGQEYATRGLPAIQAASDQKKRVLVIGLYLSTAAAKIHARSMKATQGNAPAIDPTRANDVVFSEDPLITYPPLLPWVVSAVQDAVKLP